MTEEIRTDNTETLKNALKRIEELEKENAELKCECRRCVYTDRLCILSDYGKDRNGICDHFKDVFDEVAELRENNKELAKSLAIHCQDTQEVIDKYEKENGELKRNEFNARSCLELQQSQDKAILNCMGEQLTKAKEIIREFVEWATWQGSNCPSFKSIQDKAEQFLKGEADESKN